MWDANEQSHISFLELKAVFLALNRYYKFWKDSGHIRINSDNKTAIAYLNNKGSVSVKCNILFKKTWKLCNENGCWISAEHVPGSHFSSFFFQSILQT